MAVSAALIIMQLQQKCLRDWGDPWRLKPNISMFIAIAPDKKAAPVVECPKKTAQLKASRPFQS